MEELELTGKYMPAFMEDEKEPFPIEGIGYTVFTENAQSSSCNRYLHADWEKVKYIIEYAVFWNYDIQHMYDLEHVFVYVGHDNSVVDVEASYHGQFYKSMINDELKFTEETHPVLYLQPGKHGVMPDPHYFALHTEFWTSCMENCGKDGLLVPDMFKGCFSTDAETDAAIDRYMKKHFAFVPSNSYRPVKMKESWLMPFAKLRELIVAHVEKEVRRIKSCSIRL